MNDYYNKLTTLLEFSTHCKSNANWSRLTNEQPCEKNLNDALLFEPGTGRHMKIMGSTICKPADVAIISLNSESTGRKVLSEDLQLYISYNLN